MMEEGQRKGSTHGRGHAQLCQWKGGSKRGDSEQGREERVEGREGRLEAPVTAQRLVSPRPEVHKPAAGLLQDVGSKAERRLGYLS
jgi:hypothetical protein